MKNYFRFCNLFLILFLPLIGISQSIEVEYKIVSNFENVKKEGELKEISNNVLKNFNSTFKLIESMKMNLKATYDIALYSGNNQMSNDVDALQFNMAKIMIGSDKKYYYDLNSGIVSKWFNSLGKSFIIEDSIIKTNWDLLKETKQIGNYTCYKAETTYEIVNSKGKFKKQVIAWYAIDIPYKFGPKGFCGLPGLILELEDDKITYVVDNIIFNGESTEIERLPKGKVITQEKLDRLVEIAREERNTFLKRKG